jgi:phenylacetate-coenzyme A ligase PaaK-like adenylate-forming protein
MGIGQMDMKGGHMAKGERTSGYFNEKRETMPPEERWDSLNEKLRGTVTHAYDNSRAVKHKLDKAQVRPKEIETIDDRRSSH